MNDLKQVTVYMLGHKSLSGKDTVCKIMEKYIPNLERIAFADLLKSVVSKLYLLQHDQVHGESKDVIDLRYNVTPRQILQKFGQDQRSIWPEIWAAQVFHTIDDILKSKNDQSNVNKYTFVITDFRFRNEYIVADKWVRQNLPGFWKNVIPVKIVRNIEAKSGKDDISEHDLDNFEAWKYYIFNNGTIEELECAVKQLINWEQ